MENPSPSFVIIGDNHFSSVFEELWKNGIDAEARIKDVEEGVDLADIEVIQNPRESIKRGT